jgi:protein-L-isoaspartate O-methyltransferase
MPDTVVSRAPTAGRHVWNKNPEAILAWLEALTARGSLVFDPFTGGGTVPAVCKQLGRNFVAFEICPDTAQKARERIRNTPMPLFIPEPEETQASFAFAGPPETAPAEDPAR